MTPIRDPQAVLDALHDLMKVAPDERVAQAIMNAVHPNTDPFYMEDHELASKLRSYRARVNQAAARRRLGVPDPPTPNAIENVWVTGTGQHIVTHPPEDCEGRPCVVHNPSDHHMREWPTRYRFDRGLTERICPHGVGHPDPDTHTRGDDEGDHGCDGCCRKGEAFLAGDAA